MIPTHMPLRNFGLSVFRQGARANAGVTRPLAHGVGLAVLIVMLIVLAVLFGW